jgi:hypothetical protein
MEEKNKGKVGNREREIKKEERNKEEGKEKGRIRPTSLASHGAGPAVFLTVTRTVLNPQHFLHMFVPSLWYQVNRAVCLVELK